MYEEWSDNGTRCITVGDYLQWKLYNFLNNTKEPLKYMQRCKPKYRLPLQYNELFSY